MQTPARRKIAKLYVVFLCATDREGCYPINRFTALYFSADKLLNFGTHFYFSDPKGKPRKSVVLVRFEHVDPPFLNLSFFTRVEGKKNLSFVSDTFRPASAVPTEADHGHVAHQKCGQILQERMFAAIAGQVYS